MREIFLITGATGLIGMYLAEKLIEKGYDYIAVSTNKRAAEKKLSGYKKILTYNELDLIAGERFKAVINLAGSNLGSKRWTDSAKKDFYDSRINSIESLLKLFEKMEFKPQAFVSASGVDYYGDTGSREMHEDSPPAKSFLGQLTNEWEQAALKAGQFGVRTVVLRTGFVLAKKAEAVKKLLMPLKLFVGGPIGSGSQYVSWIHIDDLAELYIYAAENKNLHGIFNAAAPEPVTNSVLIKEAAKLLHRPAIMPAPAFMLKAVLGEMSSVVLEGRKAMPDKIIASGFNFRFTNIKDAWKDIIK